MKTRRRRLPFGHCRIVLGEHATRYKRLHGLSPDDVESASYEVIASPERFFVMPFAHGMASAVIRDELGNLWGAVFDADAIAPLTAALSTARLRHFRVCAAGELLGAWIPGDDDGAPESRYARLGADTTVITRAELSSETLVRADRSLARSYVTRALAISVSVGCGIAATQAVQGVIDRRFAEQHAAAATVAERERTELYRLSEEYARWVRFRGASDPAVAVVANVVSRLDTLGTIAWLELQADSLSFEIAGEQISTIPDHLARLDGVRSATLVGGIRRDEDGDGDQRAVVRVSLTSHRPMP
jgi:hypothetical protein